EGGDRFSLTAPRHFAAAPEDVTHVVRGSIPDGSSQVAAYADLIANPDVVGVFSDPVIESSIVCPGDPAGGSDADVAKQPGVGALGGQGMNGTGVTVAIVDTGFNLPYLKSKGLTLKFSAAKSWTPAGVATKPGQHPVNHGTMCAYDVAIAAP